MILKKQLQLALQFHQQRELERAETCYQQLLQQYPDCAEALHSYGFLQVQNGEYQQALTLLQQALALEPNNPQFINSIGNVYYRMGDYAKAIECYQLALARHPDYAECYHNLGNAYQKKAQIKPALLAYAKATELAPDYIDAHYHLGWLLFQEQQYPAAIIALHNVIELLPEHIHARFLLGNIYLQQDHIDEAIMHYQLLLEWQPHHVEAIINLGAARLKQQAYHDALVLFSKAIELDNSHIVARENLASTHLLLGRFDEAIYHYQLILKQQAIGEISLDIYYNLGVAFMSQGQLHQAITNFQKLLSMHPLHEASLINLAACYVNVNLREDAYTIYQKLHTQDRQNEITNFMLAAMTGKNLPQAPRAYIEKLFDNYANFFERHASGGLSYCVPNIIKAVVMEHIGIALAPWAIADLGCGTGLIAKEFQGLTTRIDGVDISQKMLEQAQPFYDHCYYQDLLTFLQNTDFIYDGVIAADSLVYCGELTAIFLGIDKILATNGWLCLTVEKYEGTQDYCLTPFGRFAHHQQYLIRLCQNLKWHVIDCHEVILRMHQDKPLSGYVLLAQKIN